MLFFKKKVTRKFVVEQRTPDIVPFEVPVIERPEPKKDEVNFKPFVSSMYGTMVKDDIYIPKDDSDITKYDSFRTNPIVKEDNPYKGFNMVEEPKEPIVRRNEEYAREEEEKKDTSPFVFKSYEEVMAESKATKEEPIPNEDPLIGESYEEETFEPEVEIRKPVKRTVTPKVEIREEIAEDDEGEFIDDLIPRNSKKTIRYDSEGTKDPDDSISEELFGYESQKEERTEVKPVREVKPRIKKEEITEPVPEIDPNMRDENGLTFEERCIINSGYKAKSYKKYKRPPMDIFNEIEVQNGNDDEWIRQEITAINETLKGFRVEGKVERYTQGPTFTRFSISLGIGVPGSKVTSMQNDLQRYLAVPSLRIQNPIPGTSYIGIEVPNKKRRTVCIRELLEKKEFLDCPDQLGIPIGLDVEGATEMANVATFPHALVAGASGSGKSVFLNSVVTSLMVKNSPDQLRFFFIDPKKVDLSKFSRVPHLLTPVVSDVKPGIAALKWLIQEMERRLSVFRIAGTSDIKGYKKLIKTKTFFPDMPYIVAIIDECADFLMNGGQEAQDLITKLVQKSRAAGIHLILALQKPIAKIMSTAIKSNASSRFAFKVANQTDSQLILDEGGAENLLGRGDMIYANNYSGRFQAAYIDDEEISRIVDYVATQGPQDFFFDPNEIAKKSEEDDPGSIDDELFPEIARFTVDQGKWSTNQVCQRYKMAFNRATKIARVLEYYEIIEPAQGTKPRGVLKTREELEVILGGMK